MKTRQEVSGIALPAWANAGYLLRLCDYDAREFTTQIANNQLVLPADPGRWALGFSRAGSTAANVRVSCWGNPAVYGQLVSTASLDVWYTLLQYGPMVTYQWLLWSDAVEDIIVHSVSYRG